MRQALSIDHRVRHKTYKQLSIHHRIRR